MCAERSDRTGSRPEAYVRGGESAWDRIKLAINGVFLLLLLGSIIPVLYLTGFSLTPHGTVGGEGKVHLRFMFWGGPEQLGPEKGVGSLF